MKRKLRVLFVTRRFWPHGGYDGAASLLSLATGLHRAGLHIEVLTPRYASTWPDAMCLRELTIHRPAAAPRSDWSMVRYLRHVTSWLKQHLNSFDLVFCDNARDEIHSVIEASRSTPIAKLARVTGWGRGSDIAWWDHTRGGSKTLAATKLFDGVVVHNANDHRALLARGFTPSRVHRIDPGFATGPVRNPLARAAARRVLAHTNGDLAADIHAPVVLCMGRMTSESGMALACQSVRLLVARFPDLRFWFVGDGPQRETFYANMRSDGVRASIAMPGSFLDMDDLIAASDLYLQTDDEGLDHYLPTVLTSELPVVAARSESILSLLGTTPDAEPLLTWFQPQDEKSLRDAIRSAIENIAERKQAASSLRKILIRQRPQHVMLDRYAELIRQLVDTRSDTASSSIEVAS